MWDELDEPLGFASGAAAALPVRRKRPIKGAAAIGAAILAMALGLLTVQRRDLSLSGEPFAVAKVEVALAPRKADAPDATASVRRVPAPPAADGAQVEATSGVKVTRGSGGPPKAVIIDVAQALGVKLAPAPDPRLVEKSKFGLLPRIGVDGARPIDVYARTAVLDPSLKAGSPRIALVVGGSDLNTAGVGGSVAKLPGAVTLWFAPTGAAVDEQAAQARETGHETVLQARLDGFPDSSGDPGSNASTATVSDMESLDSLRWQMGRFTGYVAVVKDLGDKSFANPQPASPILHEIANRGLGYLDDGGSPRDVTPDSAASPAMPSARADIVIDTDARPEVVDAALKQLVELARQRGSSIGIVSATPASISRLAQWANELETKGVALVPLSALMSGASRPFARSSGSVSP